MVTTAIRDSGIIARASEIAYNATSAETLNLAVAKTTRTRMTAVTNKKCASLVSLVWRGEVLYRPRTFLAAMMRRVDNGFLGRAEEDFWVVDFPPRASAILPISEFMPV